MGSELESRLAEWSEESQGPSGEWYIPVLTAKSLQQHLSANEFEFAPRSTSQSTFQWAHFLRSLGIMPGGGIIHWRRARPEESPLSQGTMWLEIEGEAFCHIVNHFLGGDVEATGFDDENRISLAVGPEIRDADINTAFPQQSLRCSLT